MVRFLPHWVLILPFLCFASVVQANTTNTHPRTFYLNERYEKQILLNEQRLNAMKSVSTLEQYKAAEKQLKDIDIQHTQLSEEYAWLGRMTSDDERNVKQALKDQSFRIMSEFADERMRIYAIDDVREYQDKQTEERAVKDAQSMVPENLPLNTEWDQKIENDKLDFLAEIQLQLDQWSGRSTSLIEIREKIEYLIYREPDWYRAYCVLAIYHAYESALSDRFEDTQNAYRAVEQAKRLAPDEGEPYVVEAFIHINVPMKDSALASLRKASTRKGNSWLQHALMGNLYLGREEYKSAEESLSLALSLTENQWQQSEVQQQYARMYFLTGQLAKARVWLSKALDNRPDSAWIRGNFALTVLHMNGDSEFASQLIEQAKERYSYGKLSYPENDAFYLLAAQAVDQLSFSMAYKAWQARDGVRFSIKQMMPRVGKFRHAESANKLISFMMMAGADINQTDNQQKSALHIAAENGNLETVQLLLAQKADLELKDQAQSTPLHTAIANGKSTVALYLMEAGADIQYKHPLFGSLLFTASDQGLDEVVEVLIKNGADVNEVVTGETPLTTAIMCGRLSTVKLLVKHGASTTYKVQDKWSLEDLAREGEQSEILAYLESREAMKKDKSI